MCSGNYFWGAGKLFIEGVLPLIRDNGALNTQNGGLSGGCLARPGPRGQLGEIPRFHPVREAERGQLSMRRV